MAAIPSWLRLCAAIVLAAGILGLGSGCKRGSEESGGTVTVSGTVTFTRTPMQYDANGAPTGLGSSGTQLVARGVTVRVLQLHLDPDPSGTLVPTWRLCGSVVTDGNGYYSISNGVTGGCPTLVELAGIWRQGAGTLPTVQVCGDPLGIRSPVPQPSRPIYVYREDINGLPFLDPTAFTLTQSPPYFGTPAVIHNDTTVNFALGTTDTWATTVPNWYQAGALPYTPGADPRKPVETLAVGSAVLCILDSVNYFNNYYGDPTPSQTPGGVLDLHWHPGVTESPRRSYVVYDPTLMAATAWDGTKLHYFGTLAGGPAVNDALDPGVIYPLLARDNLSGQGKSNLFPYGQGAQSTLPPSLAPDLAVMEGLGDAMAATLLATPYLTDLSAPGVAGRDIRVFPSTGGMYSPATLAALGWQLTLMVNNIAPPGSPAAWGTGNPNPWSIPVPIFPTLTARFYSLKTPSLVIAVNAGEATVLTDVNSILAQISRLEENHTEDLVNLSRIFNDPILTPLLYNPYNIIWPGLTTVFPPNTIGYPPFATYWGLNPDSSIQALPAFTLSMANAQLEPNPAVLNPVPASVYLNDSQGEVAYAKLDLNLDRTYAVSLTTVPPLGTLPPAASGGPQIEVVTDNLIRQPLLFDAANTAAQSLVLKGYILDPTNQARHWFRVRMLSPAAVQPDLQVTVNLVRIN